MKDIFVSYSNHDRSWAEWLAWHLEEEGYTTVLQAWDFQVGGNFVSQIHKAASEARRTLLVLSPDYLTSDYAEAEWSAAFQADPTGKEGRLLPVRVRACEPRGLLAAAVYVDLVGLQEEKAREVLLSALRRTRAKPTREPGFPGPRHETVETPTYPGRSAIPKGVRRQRNRAAVWLAGLVAVVLLALGIGWQRGWTWPEEKRSPLQRGAAPAALDGIYRVRVIVLDPTGSPVEEAQITSSLGGELKRVARGWQLDIPAASVPRDGVLKVWAEGGNGFLKGEQLVKLGGDMNPSIGIAVAKEARAEIRGRVRDRAGNGVPSATVYLMGYADESTTTDDTGGFVLSTHLAPGEEGRLLVEKAGFRRDDRYLPVGRQAIEIVLYQN